MFELNLTNDRQNQPLVVIGQKENEHTLEQFSFAVDQVDGSFKKESSSMYLIAKYYFGEM